MNKSMNLADEIDYFETPLDQAPRRLWSPLNILLAVLISANFTGLRELTLVNTGLKALALGAVMVVVALLARIVYLLGSASAQDAMPISASLAAPIG